MATAPSSFVPLPELSKQVADWVGSVAQLTTPERIHWCDGSPAETARLSAQHATETYLEIALDQKEAIKADKEMPERLDRGLEVRFQHRIRSAQRNLANRNPTSAINNKIMCVLGRTVEGTQKALTWPSTIRTLAR